MCQADERILERLNESGVGTAWKIAYDLNRRVGHVRRRCLVLADADFVDVVRREGHGDQCAITDTGRGYLFGEYDADLRRPVPGPRPPEYQHARYGHKQLYHRTARVPSEHQLLEINLMYGLSAGDRLFNYTDEVSLSTIQKAISYHADQSPNKRAKFKSIVCAEDISNVLRQIQTYNKEVVVSVDQRTDHYNVSLKRKIKRSDIEGGERTVEGSFALFQPLADSDIWTAVMANDTDFYQRGVEWLFKQGSPDLSEVYINSADLEDLLDKIRQTMAIKPDIRVDKAVSYTRRDEGTISFETSPYKEVFRVSEDNDKYVDKISFDVKNRKDTIMSAHITRGGMAKFISGDIGFFFNTLLAEYAKIAQKRADVFSDKERSAETGEVNQIDISFESDVFTQTSDHDDLIDALGNLKKSSITVYHRNPYAHLSVLDFVDGSSCDVYVTDPDTISIVPSYSGSLNSLMRISEQISQEFDEGNAAEVQEPNYTADEFFSS